MAEPRGPFGWQLLRESDASSAGHAVECAFYGDARVVGVERVGAVELVTAIDRAPVGQSTQPRMYVWFYRDLLGLDSTEVEPDPPRLQTDAALYHGGSIDDEIAALMSLSSAVRLRSGGITRYAKDATPFGQPVEASHMPVVHPVPTNGGPSALQHLESTVTLADAVPWLENFGRLEADAAIALLRAARSYQLGVWSADDDMSLAWIRLVSAIETAASYWRKRRSEHTDLLREFRPEFFDRLQPFGESVIEIVATELRQTLGATKSFCEFVLAFRPEPPSVRPSPAFQLDWSEGSLRAGLKQIYRYRSEALHSARPFPGPMCLPPFQVPAEDGVAFAERPIGLAASMMGGTWAAKDMPMTLSTFEYLVRGALKAWWSQGCPAADHQ